MKWPAGAVLVASHLCLGVGDAVAREQREASAVPVPLLAELRGTRGLRASGLQVSGAGAKKLDGQTGGGQPYNPWASTEPLSTDFNKESVVEGLPVTIETMFALLYCLIIASVPLVLASLADEPLTRAHMLESVALIAWLGTSLFFFTEILRFTSVHWEGSRPLTIVEAVYLMSQILTTVGYGDITPAYPAGQLWLGINVIIALCLYGSIIMEVIQIIQARIARALEARMDERYDPSTSLIDWEGNGGKVDKKGLYRSGFAFGSMVLLGTVFWHYYPGENKDWLRGLDLSIITLSSVGFGTDNAVTEGGKVFAAVWMLMGVSSLAALIGSFIEVMLREKQREQYVRTDTAADFQRLLDSCVPKGSKIDRQTYLQFALMLTKKLDQRHFLRIQRRWNKLISQSSGRLLWRTEIWETEGPTL